METRRRDQVTQEVREEVRPWMREVTVRCRIGENVYRGVIVGGMVYSVRKGPRPVRRYIDVDVFVVVSSYFGRVKKWIAVRGVKDVRRTGDSG